MNNNGLIEYKESYVTKVKNFFKRLFSKNNISQTPNDTANKIENDEVKDKFAIEYKVDIREVNNVVRKNNFLIEIEKNPAKLNMLSIDRLERLEKYYDSIIEENDRKIKKLKNC